MSIYISGMELPKSCAECRFFVDAWCYAFEAEDWRNGYNSPLDGERLENCPLVEVPPHGALKDADALLAEIKPDRPEDFEQAVTIHVLKKVLRDHINSAPTIIPADPAEEEQV